MSLGQLVVELQANLAKTQQDMGRLNQIVEATMTRVDQQAARASKSIENIGQAGRGIRRVEGADEAAASLNKVEHASVGARREMLVIAHELSQGNFKRAAGSVMVLGERMDWMGKIMSPTGAAIGLVVAIVGGLAYAFYEAAKASEVFNNSLKETGSFAALTENTFRQMTNSIADEAHVSLSAATEAGIALIRTGQFQVTSLHDTEMAMLNFMKVSGENAESAAKQFARMREDAVKWAEENNDHYHVVTGAQLAQMESLQKLGDKQSSYGVLLHALLVAQGGELEHVTTLWERFINVVKQAGMIEASAAPAYVVPAVPPEVLESSREMDHLLQIQQVTDAKAKQYEADVFHATQRDIQFQKTFATQKMKREEETAEKLRDDALLGKSAADIARDIALINEKYKDKKSGGNIPRADLNLALRPLQDQITAEDRLLAFREKALEGYYKRDQISIEAYYSTRQTVIEANAKRVSGLYDQEIAIEEKYARSTKGAQHIEALMRVQALQDQKEQAALRTGEQIALISDEKAAATEKYRQEVEKLNSELDKLNNRSGANAGADFDRANSAFMKQATAANDAGTLAKLAQAREAAVAQGQMNEQRQQAKVITEALDTAEKRIALDILTGQESELQGMLDLSRARVEAAQQLDAIASKMTGIAEGSGMPALIADAQKFKLSTDQVAASSNVMANSINNTFATGFAGILDNTIHKTKTLKESFLDFANSVEQSLTRLISQDLFNRLFSVGSGSASSGGSGSGLIGQLIGLAMSAMGGGAAGSENLGASATSTPDDLISGYRASGGPTIAGGMYEVNERGPELLTVANRTFLMMGDEPGTVTPNPGSGKSGAGNTFNMQIAVPAGTSRATAQQQAREIMTQANIAMARNS